jgi:hypothetical protein
VDIAVNLVESYLRLTGYLTLSEFEVQRRNDEGRFTTVTDIDIMAVRMPGAVFVGDPHEPADYELLEIHDSALALEDGVIDVIIGEVKQGAADLNAGMKDHAVLHTMLRRVVALYDEPVDVVIRGLQRSLVHRSPAHGGGAIRTRLMAFGRSQETTETVMSLSHIVTTMLAFFEQHEDAMRAVQFREPAPAFLRLLLKTGFDVAKEPRSEPPG